MYKSMSDTTLVNEITVQVSLDVLYSKKSFAKKVPINVKVPCKSCDDYAKLDNSHRSCSMCGGCGYTCQTRNAMCIIHKGARNGEELKTTEKFPNLKFVMEEEIHEHFKRKDNDLLVKMNIPLSEALAGFNKTIVLPDKTKLKISSQQGLIIEHEHVYCVKNNGFPYENGDKRGDLFIQFDVDTTDPADERIMDKVAKMLPKETVDCSNAQEVILEDIQIY